MGRYAVYLQDFYSNGDWDLGHAYTCNDIREAQRLADAHGHAAVVLDRELSWEAVYGVRLNELGYTDLKAYNTAHNTAH